MCGSGGEVFNFYIDLIEGYFCVIGGVWFVWYCINWDWKDCGICFVVVVLFGVKLVVFFVMDDLCVYFGVN